MRETATLALESSQRVLYNTVGSFACGRALSARAQPSLLSTPKRNVRADTVAPSLSLSRECYVE